MSNQAGIGPSSEALDPTVPEKVDAAASALLWALTELVRQLEFDPDHWHFSHSTERRSAQDGDLVEYGVSFDLVVCPSWKCGAPDDGGVSSWSRWAYDKNLSLLAGAKVRSDEEMAAAAIQKVIPQARIQKQGEESTRRTADFVVVLPDGTKADVETTMHTDGPRRQVAHGGSRRVGPELRNEWHVLAKGKRFLNDCAGDNTFQVKEVLRILAAVLSRVEDGKYGLADNARIGELCEQEVLLKWQWATNHALDSEPPLAVSILGRTPADRGRGGIHLTIATSVFHFSKVTDVSGLVSAVQQRIDHKLEKDQWGDTANSKWLVVVLDEGEAATQLKGVTEFDDSLLEFDGLAFPGIDEVWVVTFDDGKLTVLRFTGSSQRWRRYMDLELEPRRDAN